MKSYLKFLLILCQLSSSTKNIFGKNNDIAQLPVSVMPARALQKHQNHKTGLLQQISNRNSYK